MLFGWVVFMFIFGYGFLEMVLNGSFLVYVFCLGIFVDVVVLIFFVFVIGSIIF